MAYIGHRCGCGHMDIHHDAGAKKTTCSANNGNSCGKGCQKNPKASVAPTFDVKGNTVERVVQPGHRFGNEEKPQYGPIRTCDCDACRALYTELTGIELEPAPA